MIGLLRLAKLLSIALIIGFIGVDTGASPDFNGAIGPGVPTPGVPSTGVPQDPGVPTGGPQAPGPGNNPTTPGVPTNGVPTTGPAPSRFTCDRAGNGGNTDTGVTADKIRLASTIVQTGAGESFLGDSPTGMLAVVNKINSQGGICGRLLDLKMRDDGWEASRGLSYLKSFIAEGVFALPVVPSSEGLTAAIEAGEISKSGIPVVGSDGMLKQQYEDDWVWPVATATVSAMRVIAKHAYAKGARCFGIVWDTRYRFGKEGQQAFVEYVKTLPGARMCADQGILPGRASYSSEIQSFNSSCDSKCDAVALLLEPQTALTWLKGSPQVGSKVTSGAQTLFNEGFARECAELCSGFLMWTGYNPPIDNLRALPGVKEYVDDVEAVSPTVDEYNQFLEGAYLGMTVFVEALKAVGPELTRERLAAVMNSTSFRHDIAQQLSWSASKRNANCSAQAFKIVTNQGSFSGFGNAQTGFVKDPKC